MHHQHAPSNFGGTYVVLAKMDQFAGRPIKKWITAVSADSLQSLSVPDLWEFLG